MNRKPAQASSSPFCSDTRGHDTREGASFENGKPASDASARRERTIPGQPTMILALQSLLTRLSITSTSACMVGLGRLLSTSVYAREQTPSNPAAGLDSLCSGAQLVLTRVQNLTADYLAQKIENQMERLSRNSSANLETTMSDDFSVTDTLELASEKLTRCCGRQTSPSDSIASSLVACLEQEKVDQDLQKLRGFLAEFNETSMVPVTEQILQMEKVLKQGNSSLKARHTSSPLDAILQSVTRLEKLTRLLFWSGLKQSCRIIGHSSASLLISFSRVRKRRAAVTVSVHLPEGGRDASFTGSLPPNRINSGASPPERSKNSLPLAANQQETLSLGVTRRQEWCRIQNCKHFVVAAC